MLFNLHYKQLLLDFSKAFLGHKLILNKIEQLGVMGQAKAWFKSYLEGRSQVDEIRHIQNFINQEMRSRPLTNNKEVCRGSVLRPVLFNPPDKRMPQYLGTYYSPLMYADDTTDNPIGV